jgi:Protein of unknown function (DUF3307)
VIADAGIRRKRGQRAVLILLSMLIFQIKHFLCDFALQTSNQVRNKGTYFHPAGITHAGLHMIGSIPALLVLSRAPIPLAVLLIGEFLFHYHTDWAKVKLDSHLRLNDQNSLYWIIFGSDQLIHQLTYLGMIYAILYLF